MKLELTLSPKTIIVALVLITLVLVSASLSLQLYVIRTGLESEVLGSITRLFNVDHEVSIPTWFNSILLLICASLLYAAFRIRRVQHRADRYYWLALAAIFLYLSIDEKAGIHELAIPVFQGIFNATGWFFLAWVIPAIPALLVFGFIFWHFWRGLPAPTRSLFALSGILYVGGALGLEMVGAGATLDGSLARLLAITTEELMEMLGASLCVYTLLGYLAAGAHSVQFSSRLASASVRPARALPLGKGRDIS